MCASLRLQPRFQVPLRHHARQTSLFTVLGDLDVLAFHHGGDGGVPSITEACEQDGVGVGVEGGLGPSPLVRR